MDVMRQSAYLVININIQFIAAMLSFLIARRLVRPILNGDTDLKLSSVCQNLMFVNIAWPTAAHLGVFINSDSP